MRRAALLLLLVLLISSKSEAKELRKTTAYTPQTAGSVTCTGDTVRYGICAVDRDHVGWQLDMWAEDGTYIGRFDCLDTGGDGVQHGVIDVWMPTLKHAQGWMEYTNGRVYIDYINTKERRNMPKFAKEDKFYLDFPKVRRLMENKGTGPSILGQGLGYGSSWFSTAEKQRGYISKRDATIIAMLLGVSITDIERQEAETSTVHLEGMDRRFDQITDKIVGVAAEIKELENITCNKVTNAHTDHAC